MQPLSSLPSVHSRPQSTARKPPKFQSFEEENDDASIIPNPHSAAHYFTLLNGAEENGKRSGRSNMERLNGMATKKKNLKRHLKQHDEEDDVLDDRSGIGHHSGDDDDSDDDDSVLLQANKQWKRKRRPGKTCSAFRSFTGVLLAIGFAKLIGYLWKVFLRPKWRYLSKVLTSLDARGRDNDTESGKESGVRLHNRMSSLAKEKEKKNVEKEGYSSSSSNSRQQDSLAGILPELPKIAMERNDDDSAHDLKPLKQEISQLKTMMQSVIDREDTTTTPNMEHSSRTVEMGQMRQDISSVRRSLQDVQYQIDRITQRFNIQDTKTGISTNNANDIKIELAQIKGILMGLKQSPVASYHAGGPPNVEYPRKNNTLQATYGNVPPSDTVSIETEFKPRETGKQVEYREESDSDDFDMASAEYARQQYSSVVHSKHQKEKEDQQLQQNAKLNIIAESSNGDPTTQVEDVYRAYTSSILPPKPDGNDDDDTLGESHPKKGVQTMQNIETHYITDDKDPTKPIDDNDSEDGDETASDTSFDDLFQKAMDAKHLNPFSAEFSRAGPQLTIQDDYSYTPNSLSSSLARSNAQQEDNNEDKLADIRRKTEIARNADSRLKNLKLFKFVDKLTSGSLDLEGKDHTLEDKSSEEQESSFPKFYEYTDSDTATQTVQSVHETSAMADQIHPLESNAIETSALEDGGLNLSTQKQLDHSSTEQVSTILEEAKSEISVIESEKSTTETFATEEPMIETLEKEELTEATPKKEVEEVVPPETEESAEEPSAPKMVSTPEETNNQIRENSEPKESSIQRQPQQQDPIANKDTTHTEQRQTQDQPGSAPDQSQQNEQEVVPSPEPRPIPIPSRSRRERKPKPWMVKKEM